VKARPVGDRAVLLEAGSVGEVHRLWAALAADRPDGVLDVVPGAATVLVVTSGQVDMDRTVAGINRLVEHLDRSGPAGSRADRPLVSIPVVYDGPDLEGVAATTGLDRADVVRLHAAPLYRVDFLGFSPGFGYLSGADPRLAVPRLPTPRTSVPAGSVALAAEYTAVYPQPTPGGWQVIGRTDATMFDPGRPDPALLSPGDRVRFVAVERSSGAAPAGPTGAPGPALGSPIADPGPGAPAVEVLDPGPMLTVQDLGRTGWAHLGVPVAGALDRGAAAEANRLAGNLDRSALLESTLGGCRLRLRASRIVAVTGAEADLTVDGLPARSRVGLPLPGGTELAVGRCRLGLRVYIAIGGGLDSPAVLGSRSTDTLSGLGPAPLRRGDRVGLGPAPLEQRADAGPDTRPRSRSTEIEVEARLGPRENWLSASGLATLAGAEFSVRGSSDRTGVRLEGPTVERTPREIPPEGMVAGAVQVPPDGQPIVLMRNHPSTGGYPVVAVVDEAGVDRLAQAPPGSVVRFRLKD
jgi:KipI family sensor histidine kinase inhibitor